MENAPEKSPSAILLRQARRSWDDIQAHRLENLRKQAKELLDQFGNSEPTAIQRFTANHPNFPKDAICLADAQSVIAREHGYPSWPKMKAHLGQVTLADEVERIHRKLHADGKDHFVPMFSEESLKSAILKGIQSYESLPNEIHQPHEGAMQYLEDTIKPLLLEAVENGTWSDKSAVDVYYQQKDERGVIYEGLGAELDILTPGAKYPGFCLSILDVWYGRF